ncbi:hypothetical protein KI387_031353, partial [Taxus chinensis]
AVKEVRGTPSNKQTKFVEFFDVRDAERAREGLDGKHIGSEQVTIHFSRLGGRARKGPARTIHNLPPRHARTVNFTWNSDKYCWTHKVSASACTARGELKRCPVYGSATKNGKKESLHTIIEEDSSQFVFDEAQAALNCEKARTSVMIKNIPNQY